MKNHFRIIDQSCGVYEELFILFFAMFIFYYLFLYVCLTIYNGFLCDKFNDIFENVIFANNVGNNCN